MTPEENTNPSQGQYTQNPYNPNTGYQNWGGGQQTPNSTTVLVLGILSIVMCWCYGIVSIILAIIAIILANAGEKEYRQNPQAYSVVSYKNLNAGKTCAIIGLCLSAVTILCYIIYFVMLGTLAFNLFNFMDN